MDLPRLPLLPPMKNTIFVHPGRGLAETLQAVRQVGLDVSEPRPVQRTLLDTPDGRLFAEGMTLQAVRTGDSGLHLHLDRDGSAPEVVAITFVPRWAKELPRGAIGDRLQPLVDVRVLLPLVTFEEQIATAVERDADGRVVATVSVSQLSGAADLPCTVTVTAASGHAKPAKRIGRQLRARGFEPTTDDQLGPLTAAAGIDRRGIHFDATVPLSRHTPAARGFRDVLLNLLDTVHANWQGTIEDLDTEFLHDLRVAVRRTRSVIGQSKRVLPESLRSRYRDDFAWLAAATGPTRDLDAYALQWPHYTAGLSVAGADALQPVLDHILRHRHLAHAELVVVLESARAHTLLADWRIALTTDPVDPPSQAGEPLGAGLGKRFRQAHRTVLHQGRRIDGESPAEQLHDLRKDAKKLRYLVECFSSAMPDRLQHRFVKQLKALQDNLGEHQDAQVHAAELTRVARELSAEHVASETLLGLGALTERLDQAQREARAEFSRRFAAYDSPDTERIVEALVEALES
jgi:CHAD domain-containing protein